MIKLSIVSTLYKSAKEIGDFHKQVTAVAQKFAGDDYEIILVNDGSPDNCYEIALQIAQSDRHIVLVDLSRNFGQHKALMTGLMLTHGDLIMMMDSDLEEDPRWFNEFYEVMCQQHHDIVVGVQKLRKGGIFERYTGDFFYYIFNRLSGFDYPRNTITARLMTRRFVDALLLHKESELFLGGLTYSTGFSHGFVYITKKHSSETSYTLRKKLKLVINSITSFSSMPLYVISCMGIVLFVLAVIAASYMIYTRFTQARIIEGWVSLFIGIVALGGLQLSSLGIIGLYIAKIFIETKKRPLTIIRSIYHKEPR
jgi:putative glycosyltransferase